MDTLHSTVILDKVLFIQYYQGHDNANLDFKDSEIFNDLPHTRAYLSTILYNQ